MSALWQTCPRPVSAGIGSSPSRKNAQGKSWLDRNTCYLQCTLLLNQNLFVHICSYCIVTSVIIIRGDAGWHSWLRHFTASCLQQQPSAAERDSAGFCVILHFPSVIYLTVLQYRTFIRQAHSCYSNPQSLGAVLSGKMKSCHEIEMDKIFFVCLSTENVSVKTLMFPTSLASLFVQ